MPKPRRAVLHRLPMRHPGDTAAIEALIEAGRLDPANLIAILGKTEGNGCVNDFTRAYAVQSLQMMLARRIGAEAAAQVAMVMSGGTEGGLSPHFLLLSVEPGEVANPAGALAIGTAFTRDFAPEEIGRMPQVEAVAAAVRTAMAEAGIAGASDVHYVQVKCPLLTSERMEAAAARGATVATGDTYASMGLSRGASALGVALALGEIDGVSPEEIGQDWAKHSAVASASAGVELERCEVIILGNSPDWAGDLAIAHAVMQDAIDLPAIHRALASVGLPTEHGQLAPVAAQRLVAVLAKAEPSSNGRIRGQRHIMWDDSDINATRHARALVGGVIAGAVGRTDIFVSGGAEHQGPDGGGPVAVIARRAP
ncbi:cyanuric acid amidohydrolase [Belnapia rosea]|uniref:cyanuric acid amidohydrolase n=1 Tax=Belnapia rosea TaxID=938405 RepID=UPI0008826500|nr:ring-opening amidohydrolase [Belnapia rosea]SDB53972.1 cyanuric acid amidohydrolase [Belnapia rosea]